MASPVTGPARQSKVGIVVTTTLRDGNDVVNGDVPIANRPKLHATNLAVRAFHVPETFPLFP
jgi:hypothetical protein